MIMMTLRRTAFALLLALCLSPVGAMAQDDAASAPFAQLRAAYAARDAAAAAAAYAPDARYIEAYDSERPTIITGRGAIERHLRSFLERLPAGAPIDLNFRSIRAARGRVTGLYRIRFGTGPTARTLFGRFSTRLGADGFVQDISSSADRAAFEDASGPLMFANDDEELDPLYYAPLTGSWRRADGCRWTVTRSVRRLYLLDECSGAWRGLTRVSGRDWRAGDRIVDTQAASPVHFLVDGRLSVDGVVAAAESDIARDTVNFAGPAGVLAGTLYRPIDGSAKPRAAIVLVHGSGPQDRDGYASIIQLLALRLSRAGLVVLAFDKRGVGGSAGDWTSAGFPDLAADANAAMRFVRAQAGVDSTRVGIGGSSQAGWIAARSVVDGGAPAFVLLIGAAGSAMNVEEQNLYNTGVQMRCAGFSPDQVRLALDQQAAFFAARRDPARLPELQAATASAAAPANAALNDWLFPADISPPLQPQWYDVLDTGFEPLPIWRTYQGPMLLLFSEYDDSTPTLAALRRVSTIQRTNVTVTTIPGAQHIGLATDNVCRGDVSALAGFAPGFWEAIEGWIAATDGVDLAHE
ncbi:MAG: alpha/beta hydrolase [Sphingopyxis sp.]